MPVRHLRGFSECFSSFPTSHYFASSHFHSLMSQEDNRKSQNKCNYDRGKKIPSDYKRCTRSSHVYPVLMKCAFGDGCVHVENKGQFVQEGLIFCRGNALVERMLMQLSCVYVGSKGVGSKNLC